MFMKHRIVEIYYKFLKHSVQIVEEGVILIWLQSS